MPAWRRRAGLKTIAASTHNVTGRRLPLMRISRVDAVSQPRRSIVGYSRRMEKGATPGRAGKERPQMSQPSSIEPGGMISWGSEQLLGDPDSNSFIGCLQSLQPIAVEAPDFAFMSSLLARHPMVLHTNAAGRGWSHYLHTGLVPYFYVSSPWCQRP